MGQCVSRKAGAVIAASGKSPSYRIMEKKSSKKSSSRRQQKILIRGIYFYRPIFQLLGYIKQVDPYTKKWSYRLIISDGTTTSSMIILDSNLKYFIILNHMTRDSLFEVKKYTIMSFKNGSHQRYMMYIKELKVLIPGHEIESSFKKVDVKKVIYEEVITPISDLLPNHRRWFVKGQVIHKSPLTTQLSFFNEEKFFTFYLIDETGKIRCRVFQNQCDKLYDLIKEGEFYYVFQNIPKSSIKMCNDNYEIIITSKSKVLKLGENTDKIITFNYIYDLTENIYKPIDTVGPKSLISTIGKPVMLFLSFVAFGGFSISVIPNIITFLKQINGS